MPLLSANLNSTIQWSLIQNNTPFTSTTQQGALTFNLGSLNTSIFNEIFVVQYVIPANDTQVIDLTIMEDLLNNDFAFGHALTLFIIPTGSNCTLSPGTSYPLQWFFGGTTQSVTITNGGFLCYSEPVSGPGSIVSPTARTLLLTAGNAQLTVSVGIIGSTS